MALEAATYISELNAANPTATDTFGGQSAQQIRLVKSVVLNSFPNISGAVTASHTELNYLDGVTSAVQDQLNAKRTQTISVKTATFSAAAWYIYVCRSGSLIECKLPASPTVGDVIEIYAAGSGDVEIRSSSGSSVLINGGLEVRTLGSKSAARLIYVDTTTGWAVHDA